MAAQKKTLICTAAGDETDVPVNAFLLREEFEAIAAGIKNRMEQTGSENACIYIPEQYMKDAEQFIRLAGNIQIRTGKDSPVCRDVTALLAAMNGDYIRPFYTEQGEDLIFEGNPVTEIISLEEAINYAEGENKKTFFIRGCVEKESFVRWPYGTSLKKIIDSSDGHRDGSRIKAVLVGGMSGKFFNPGDLENVYVEKENPALSGGMEILDNSVCAVDRTKQILDNCRAVSCGKCPLCREGSYQLLSAFNDITNGKGRPETVSLVRGFTGGIELGAFCQFGRNMAELVNSALNVLSNEIEDHIKRKKCPASVCRAFMVLAVLPDKCTGCGECLNSCDEDAIEGKKGFIHMISDDECTKCGKCVEACEEKAIVFVSGTKPRLPKRLTKVGQFN